HVPTLHPSGDSHTAYRSGTQLYILVFCLAWWVIYLLGRHSLDGRDMVEAFAWGQEWQWGTNKHPPMSGWMAAAWFALLPTTEAMYYLLNQVNLALALWLLALAMRCFMGWDQVLLAIVLTSLGTHFGPDQGFKFNANSALLPFVAGFTWSLLRGLSSARWRWFVLAGVFAGGALLTKYFALVLIAAIGIGITAVLRPKAMLLCQVAGVVAATAMVLCVPHVVWSIRHGWPTLHYMHESHPATRTASDLMAYAITAGDYVHFSALAILVWAGSLWRARSTPLPTPRRLPGLGLGLAILALCLCLTLLAAWIQRLVPISPWLIPAFLFVGWALVDLTPAGIDSRIVARRASVAGMIYLVLSGAAAAHLGQQYRMQPTGTPDALAPLLARDVTELYRQAYGQDIGYVAGSFPLPYNIAFYAPGHPHALAGLDPAQSPWIDPQAMAGGNRVVVCGTLTFVPAQDPECDTSARQLFGAPDQTRQLVYPVHDPLSGRPAQQVYTLLMWKPAGR
ncbi:MAG: glycosyltransferase family 39 protein, partial [Betaproteobacteria bacterium]